MNYLDFLRAVHDRVSPQRYLEIGIRNGGSLAVSKCRSVGIDPAYTVTAELDGDFALFRTTSDEYFTRPDPLAPVGGKPFDLSFIDGLHLFEFALRDFINAERHSAPTSVVVFDDVLPRSVDEAARLRHTTSWTGDVYSILGVFERYRPDLTVIPVGTAPTGLLVVVGLDPGNTALSDNYEQILAEFRRPDPQPVPPELLDRLIALTPRRVLDAGFWQALSSAPRDAGPAQIRAALAPGLQADLGADFAAVG